MRVNGKSDEEQFQKTEKILAGQVGQLERSSGEGLVAQSGCEYFATGVTHNLMEAGAGIAVEQVMFRKIKGKVPRYDATNIPPFQLEISESGWENYNWGLSTEKFQEKHPEATIQSWNGLPTRKLNMIVAGRYAPVTFLFVEDQLALVSIAPPSRIDEAIFDNHRSKMNKEYGPFKSVAAPPGQNVAAQYDGLIGPTQITHMKFVHDEGVGESFTIADRRRVQ